MIKIAMTLIKATSKTSTEVKNADVISPELQRFQVICIFFKLSSITEQRFIIMEYAWQVLAERCLFATPSAPPPTPRPPAPFVGIPKTVKTDSKLLRTISLQKIIIILQNRDKHFAFEILQRCHFG